MFTSITLHNNLLPYTRSTLRVTVSVGGMRVLCTAKFGFILLQRVKFYVVQTTEEKHIGDRNSEHKLLKVVLFCLALYVNRRKLQSMP
jgi:hypothetical protein